MARNPTVREKHDHLYIRPKKKKNLWYKPLCFGHLVALWPNGRTNNCRRKQPCLRVTGWYPELENDGKHHLKGSVTAAPNHSQNTPNYKQTGAASQKTGAACCPVPFQGGASRGPSLPPSHQRLCWRQDPHLQLPEWELLEGVESQWQSWSRAVLLYSGQQVSGRCGGQSCWDVLFSPWGYQPWICWQQGRAGHAPLEYLTVGE